MLTLGAIRSIDTNSYTNPVRVKSESPPPPRLFVDENYVSLSDMSETPLLLDTGLINKHVGPIAKLDHFRQNRSQHHQAAGLLDHRHYVDHQRRSVNGRSRGGSGIHLR